LRTEAANCNFGFRSYKSPHDALNKIYSQSQGANNAIEGDIKAAFDNVNPTTMIKILSKRISDKKFLKLIEEGFACGLIDKGKFEHTLLGTPQGGIASPILFNIYMHEFDQFVLNSIIPKYQNQSTTSKYPKEAKLKRHSTKNKNPSNPYPKIRQKGNK
jgi:retron-type reverse transcriptase